MTKSKLCVLIYNPISGHGHLDSWNALFVGLLLGRGYRILALTPDRVALESRLTQQQLAKNPLLHILDWNAPRPWRQPWLLSHYKLRIRRVWQWWLVYGHKYANRRPETRVTQEMPTRVRIKKHFFQVVVPPLFRLSRAFHALYRKICCVKKTSGDPRDFSEINFLDPIDMGKRINAALMTSPWQPDCMFNMYLDMYKTDLESWRQFAAICRLPWGGIRFVPSGIPPREGYYALPSLRGMCFLDDSACQDYSASISGKHFQYLPDVTNTELPDGSCALVEDILRRAAGRKIVFLGGSIGGQKNIARWCDLIALADPQRWFFAQVGEIHANTFTPEDAGAFERLVAVRPENLYLHTQYLSDERDFNAVIRVADVLFAAYRNFRISSNMLGKSAYLEKPIVVSDGYLMAERVRSYKIGLVVPEDEACAMLDALERLVTEPVPKENFAEYRTAFKEQSAADSLVKFFTEIIT